VRNLFHPEVAQSEVDDLYNGTLVFRKTRPVVLSGTGVIKRGSPLTSDDGETFTVSGTNIMGILLFDIDTSEVEEAENGVLGMTGEFNQNKIEEALGASLEPAAIAEAWGRQIHIEASYPYPHPDEMYPLG
jgi:hypothetical protein